MTNQETIDAETLLSQPMRQPPFLVEGLLAPGLYILAGAPKHIFNIHNKNDTFTVEGVNADLRHYIPTLARRSRCFPRKLENLQAVLAVFVQAYNHFGLRKSRYRSCHPGTAVPFSLFDFL